VAHFARRERLRFSVIFFFLSRLPPLLFSIDMFPIGEDAVYRTDPSITLGTPPPPVTRPPHTASADLSSLVEDSMKGPPTHRPAFPRRRLYVTVHLGHHSIFSRCAAVGLCFFSDPLPFRVSASFTAIFQHEFIFLTALGPH